MAGLPPSPFPSPPGTLIQEPHPPPDAPPGTLIQAPPASPPSTSTGATTSTGAFWSVVSGALYCEINNNCVSTGAGSYGNDELCTVVAQQAFTISATSFETENSYDTVTVGGTAYSGDSSCSPGCNGAPQYVFMAAGEELVWSSDVTVARSGWEICALTASSNMALPPYPPSPSPPNVNPSPPPSPLPPQLPPLPPGRQYMTANLCSNCLAAARTRDITRTYHASPDLMATCPRPCRAACPSNNDNNCDDGGPGAEFAVCMLGSDCKDCGARADRSLVRSPAPRHTRSSLATLPTPPLTHRVAGVVHLLSP
jgi:hypothetical protein